MSQKEIIKRIKEYINAACGNDDDIPTLAGLAAALEVGKDELRRLENESGERVKKSIVWAKNRIEHYLISKSALKKINQSSAQYCLDSMLSCGASGDDDFAFKISVEGDEE